MTEETDKEPLYRPVIFEDHGILTTKSTDSQVAPTWIPNDLDFCKIRVPCIEYNERGELQCVYKEKDGVKLYVKHHPEGYTDKQKNYGLGTAEYPFYDLGNAIEKANCLGKLYCGFIQIIVDPEYPIENDVIFYNAESTNYYGNDKLIIGSTDDSTFFKLIGRIQGGCYCISQCNGYNEATGKYAGHIHLDHMRRTYIGQFYLNYHDWGLYVYGNESNIPIRIDRLYTPQGYYYNIDKDRYFRFLPGADFVSGTYIEANGHIQKSIRNEKEVEAYCYLLTLTWKKQEDGYDVTINYSDYDLSKAVSELNYDNKTKQLEIIWKNGEITTFYESGSYMKWKGEFFAPDGFVYHEMRISSENPFVVSGYYYKKETSIETESEHCRWILAKFDKTTGTWESDGRILDDKGNLLARLDKFAYAEPVFNFVVNCKVAEIARSNICNTVFDYNLKLPFSVGTVLGCTFKRPIDFIPHINAFYGCTFGSETEPLPCLAWGTLDGFSIMDNCTAFIQGSLVGYNIYMIRNCTIKAEWFGYSQTIENSKLYVDHGNIECKNATNTVIHSNDVYPVTLRVSAGGIVSGLSITSNMRNTTYFNEYDGVVTAEEGAIISDVNISTNIQSVSRFVCGLSVAKGTPLHNITINLQVDVTVDEDDSWALHLCDIYERGKGCISNCRIKKWGDDPDVNEDWCK